KVTEVMRGTTIEDGDAVVNTVEHVLAALVSQGVDNVMIDMDRPEPPIADGSSLPFIELIEEAGTVEQDAEREYFVVDKPYYLEMDHAIINVVPDDKFRISCTVKYDQSQLDTQFLSMEVTADSFKKDLSEARTFCMYFELEYLMKAGLARGGSLDNANVIHGNTILSKDGLRYPDEIVRHKMLDIVGDFCLLGKPIKGHIIAVKPGHPSNVTMVQKLLKDQKEA
ncbi:MAG: UDP-3-O-acyl-N-acetylglucosamine deacetylase, partial [Lentisphaeraceae bacterium]|nr:UDP-3-O-acyl-N-acetylglucosamine deacetylase [Lentisphaeraceae bacterium]